MVYKQFIRTHLIAFFFFFFSLNLVAYVVCGVDWNIEVNYGSIRGMTYPLREEYHIGDK